MRLGHQSLLSLSPLNRWNPPHNVSGVYLWSNQQLFQHGGTIHIICAPQLHLNHLLQLLGT
jgi:hypothetical protein